MKNENQNCAQSNKLVFSKTEVKTYGKEGDAINWTIARGMIDFEVRRNYWAGSPP